MRARLLAHRRSQRCRFLSHRSASITTSCPPMYSAASARATAFRRTAVGYRQTALEIEVGSKMPHAVAGDLQFSALAVFQPDHHSATEPGIHFLDVLHVEQCRAVDAHELGRVQLLLQLR